MYDGSEIMAILLLIAIEVYLFYISYSYFSNTVEPFELDGFLMPDNQSEADAIMNKVVAPLGLHKRPLEINPGKDESRPYNTNRHHKKLSRDRGENSEEPEVNLNKQTEQLYENRRKGLLTQDENNNEINNLNSKIIDIQNEPKSIHYSNIAKPCLAGCSLDSSTDLKFECLHPEPNARGIHCLFNSDCEGCSEKWPYTATPTYAPLYKFDVPSHEIQKSSIHSFLK